MSARKQVGPRRSPVRVIDAHTKSASTLVSASVLSCFSYPRGGSLHLRVAALHRIFQGHFRAHAKRPKDSIAKERKERQRRIMGDVYDREGFVAYAAGDPILKNDNSDSDVLPSLR